MIKYIIDNKDMRNKHGVDVGKYLKGYVEGCIFELYLTNKPSRYWNNSYNKIVNACKEAKKQFNKKYTINVILVLKFNKTIKDGDKSLNI